MTIEWPKHHQIFITHNGHHTNYESIQEYLSFGEGRSKWMQQEDYERCIAMNEIWEIQLYPLTPIGSFWVAAATFEKALELMKRLLPEQEDRI